MHLTLFQYTTIISLCALLKISNAKLYERAIVPNTFTRLQRAPADHTLSLHIGLSQPNADKIENLLLKEIANPQSEKYGQHLTSEELANFLQPSEHSINAVTNWLVAHGIHDFEHSNGFITLELPVSKVESLLDTEYYVYKHKSGKQLVRTEATHLPSHVHPFVDLIQPSTAFHMFQEQAANVYVATQVHSAKHAKAVKPCPKGGCSASVNKYCDPDHITPDCLKALYNISYTPKAPAKQFFGITGYLNQFANYQDLKQFQKIYAPKATGLNFSTVLISGGANSQSLASAGMEANLDTQVATALTYPIKNTFYSVGGSPPFQADVNVQTNSNEPYLAYLQFLAAQKTVPSVITTSYGDDEQTVPLSYAKKVCSMYAQLGSRGVSILHSSGDGGVSGAVMNGECISSRDQKARFLATFPASCPYVTAVGSVAPDPTYGFAKPQAAPYSSGGFSEIFSVPSYQSKYTKNYIAKSKSNTTFPALFNPTGRGFPDVSVHGGIYDDVWQGVVSSFYGTSCSTPAFASMIALLNDKRLAAGKPVLGFLNPWLYSSAVVKAFTPVQSGTNPGCGPSPGCRGSCSIKGRPTAGFTAVTNWSPSTGLGQPNFAKLLALV